AISSKSRLSPSCLSKKLFQKSCWVLGDREQEKTWMSQAVTPVTESTFRGAIVPTGMEAVCDSFGTRLL
ncbi:hypothetical protein, partial [Pseudomonas sp. GW460-13]|uniref:hypothetical protein n=1 Tax=Pseudomonas sp. GW460-13 TaxID=2070590 RepID=UPI001C45E4A6